jgi:hypothetical protein
LSAPPLILLVENIQFFVSGAQVGHDLMQKAKGNSAK